MADVAVVAPAPAAAAGKPKKAVKKAGSAKPKKVADHPKYAQMIKEALTTLKERGGSSRQAILKYIVKQYKLTGEEKIINSHLKLALHAGVKNGTLKQSKGTGAAGSFRLGEKKTAEKKPKAAKKPTATKPKKAAVAKKPKAAAKKPKAAGSPKKAAKPKAAAKPKVTKPKAVAKPKSPKKAKAAKPAKAKSPKKAKVAAKPKVTKAKKVAKK